VVNRVRMLGLRRPLGMVLGLFALGLGVGVGLVFAPALLFGPRDATASHTGDAVVHACVRLATGDVRIILPGRKPNCSSAEYLMEWSSGDVAADLSELMTLVDDLQDDLAALESEVDTLDTDLDTLQTNFNTLNDRVPACLSAPDADTARFDGCNVQIVNGEGATGTMNGKGNLIIGYNESFLGEGKDRSGSHNLVVGPEHQYSGSAGLVAGYNNTISARWATVTGGAFNSATADGSTVIGGYENSVNTENGIAP
jgi:hypothetical protein